MSFRDIVGHEKQIAQLKIAMEQQRVPHAFLFYGMEGIGKRTTALMYAKALNCATADTDCCDACASCRKADHNNHMDIVTLETEGQFIKIQAIREIQERMKFKPWEGGKRVFIIDDAERMNDAAANALLKTLEEPPPSNIFILVSARPAQLPATILSRCRHIRFNPLSAESVALFLQQRLSLDDQTSQLLASSSGGSIARVLEMQRGSYGAMRNEVLDMLADGHMQDPLMRMSRVSHLGSGKEDVLEWLGILRNCYRDMMVYRETKETKGLIYRDRVDALGSLTGRLSTQRIIGNMMVIDRAFQALEQHADKTLTLEVMMLRLSW